MALDDFQFSVERSTRDLAYKGFMHAGNQEGLFTPTHCDSRRNLQNSNAASKRLPGRQLSAVSKARATTVVATAGDLPRPVFKQYIVTYVWTSKTKACFLSLIT